MLTFENQTLRLLGIPVFTLVVGAVFAAAFLGLLLGIPRLKRTGGKIAVIASTLVLLGFALAAACIFITVWSGSMG